MTAELDAAYATQRLRLASVTKAAAAGAWARTFRNREQAIEATSRLVASGQGHMTALVDAYMATKGGREIKGLAPPAPRDLNKVYDRPFGALAGQLGEGAAFATALAGAQARVGKLAATDLQLAQTFAAREWIAEEEGIVGYQRLISSANPCGLCLAASTQRYNREDLMPIHDACSCGVAPIYGTGPVPQTIDPETWGVVKAQAQGDLSPQRLSQLRFDPEQLPDRTLVRPDPELGLRLVDESWAAAA